MTGKEIVALMRRHKVAIKGLAALKLDAGDLAAIERGNALKLMPGLKS